jgi:uncharacterized SAM-binding protein YcdF (DUF218 family)
MRNFPLKAFGRKHLSRSVLIGAVALGLLVLLAVSISSWATAVLTSELEGRFARPTAISAGEITGIIALGGLHNRIVEAVRLARQYPRTKLVVTGAPAEDDAYVQAQEFAAGRVLLETRATTTFENAIFSKKMLAPTPHDKWLIVTSATHMSRAVGTFRKAGFSVVPWPVSDPKGAVSASEVAWHEVFGLLEYRLLGRIDSFFPSP